MIYKLMISNKQGVYNIGSGDRYTNIGIMFLIEEILKKPFKWEFVEDRKGHDRRYGLKSTIPTPIKTNLRMYLFNCFA